MIYFLENEQIDKQKWDKAVKNSDFSIVYAMSWYLDVVASGWSALVEDDYKTVMPLVSNSKMGIKYLYQPLFCQQLGVFGKDIDEEKVIYFLKNIPKQFRFAEMMLNEENLLKKYNVKNLTNIVLPLRGDIEKIREGYSTNAKRNIKKALKSNISLHKGFDIEKIIMLFKENRGASLKKSQEFYNKLSSLAFMLKHKGYATTYSALNAQNEIIAGILIVDFNNRAILLFSGANAEAKENGAMSFLLDEIIKEKLETTSVFDFEGSNDANLARFYLSFGGEKKEYPFVRINRLPLPFRLLKGNGLKL